MLSIIITHYRTPILLKLCLSNLFKNLPRGEEAQIIVSDSQSDPEIKESIEERFPQIEFIGSKENLGFARLVNRALKKARGRFILIINADIIIDRPTTLEKMLDYLKKHQSVGLIGPRLLNINGSTQASAFRFYTPAIILARRTIFGRTPWGKKLLDNFAYSSNQAIEVDWLMGSALMTSRAALEKVGGLDQRFFMYFEDVDWARRFWQNGYQVIYYPEAEMYHYHIQASKKRGGLLDILLSKYTRLHIKSALKYFSKYGLSKPSLPARTSPKSPATN